MNTQTRMATLETRINTLVDERLFQAFWAAVAHFKSDDLVLYFDENENTNPVSAYVRSRLLTNGDIDEDLREKIKKPARDVRFRLTTSETAFWFAVQFLDGERACVAINAKQILPGGNA